MVILITHPDLLRPVGGVRPPDSRIAREAVELARDVSSPVLFNHVMRCYLLGELLAQGKNNLDAWWISVFTFGVLVITLLLLTFIGDALRDALDARLLQQADPEAT